MTREEILALAAELTKKWTAGAEIKRKEMHFHEGAVEALKLLVAEIEKEKADGQGN
jgi:hypothetical protein